MDYDGVELALGQAETPLEYPRSKKGNLSLYMKLIFLESMKP